MPKDNSSILSATRLTPDLLPRKFPVVGIGASAGGVRSLLEFFKHLPAPADMAFVVVQHLDPTHESLLTDILSRATAMGVHEAQNNMAIKPRHVYVIPPNAVLKIDGGILRLLPRDSYSQPMLGIDCFFESLARHSGEHAIGVLLSGNSKDGTVGLQAIKAHGGMTCCEDSQNAEYPHMPQSAIDAGCVDIVLPPAQLAAHLASFYRRRKREGSAVGIEKGGAKEETAFKQILRQVRDMAQLDFSGYKMSTIRRRLQRRMDMLHLHSFAQYTKYLARTPDEAQLIIQDCLINVTGFFRDPAVFEALRQHVFPALTTRRLSYPLRIWVPGCSTGEEPYSLAIALQVYINRHNLSVPFQIFATDANDRVIQKARAGYYKEQAIHHLPADYRSRFFTKKDGLFQIAKTIRDNCVFARQDIAQDPPFSRIGLISCRNLLIYLDAHLQKQIFPAFHYALEPKGFLLLGSSESAGPFRHLFAPIDKKHKIFEKRDGFSERPLWASRNLKNQMDPPVKAGVDASSREEYWSHMGIDKDLDGVFLSRFAPRSILVNDSLEVVQFIGPVKHFLRPAGQVNDINVLKLVYPRLAAPLRRAARQVLKTHKRAYTPPIPFKFENKMQKIWIEINPVPSAEKQPYFLITFHDSPRTAKTRRAAARNQATHPAGTLNTMRARIESQGSANEELQAANEEIMSNNEELQSANEELETAKEELQSTNEELTTVNSELQNRNQELDGVNNDLLNLLSGVNIAIVMMDCDLCIRRFTPMAESLLNLIPTDVGRPITDLHFKIEINDLTVHLRDVLESAVSKEFNVLDGQGRQYKARIRPYKTYDNRIQGVVLTVVSSQQMKSAEDELSNLKMKLDEVSQECRRLNEQLSTRKKDASGPP